MALSQRHKLSIIEVNSIQPTPDGKQARLVELNLDGEVKHEGYIITDPFSAEDYAKLTEYLRVLVQNEPDLQDRVVALETLVKGYRKELHSQVNLNEQCHKRVEIDVHESHSTSPTTHVDTIHSFQWEQLEEPQQWQLPNLHVTVRRIVAPGNHNTKSALKKVSSWSIKGSTESSINVLLLIARNLPIDPRDQYYDIDPSIALLALISARERLKANRSTHQLHIEVVRPGSYEALEQHLERAKVIQGSGYFHMVHLDCHGQVIEGKAYLHFTSSDPLEEGYEKRSAESVANLLAGYGVSTVVLNACESARADRGIRANLSRIFAREGISNIFAMSYRFSASAAILVLTEFFDAFFVDTVPFSEAACHARRKLREVKEREATDNRQLDIREDWWVPVVYSNHKDVQITIHQHTTSRPSSSVQDTLVSLCIAASIIALGCLYTSLRFLVQSNTILSKRPKREHFRHTESIRLQDGFADTIKDNQSFLELDGQTLQLERDLIGDHTIILHGRPAVGKSQLITHLSRLWLATNFVDHIYIYQAKDFLKGWLSATVRATWSYLRGDHNHLYTHVSCPIEDIDNKWAVPKTIVIIDHIDDLYTADISVQQRARGQAALHTFLSRVLTAKNALDRCPWRPYLVLVGQHGPAWWADNFKELNLAAQPIHRIKRSVMKPLPKLTTIIPNES